MRKTEENLKKFGSRVNAFFYFDPKERSWNICDFYVYTTYYPESYIPTLNVECGGKFD
jgi:hypothetical protein